LFSFKTLVPKDECGDMGENKNKKLTKAWVLEKTFSTRTKLQSNKTSKKLPKANSSILFIPATRAEEVFLQTMINWSGTLSFGKEFVFGYATGGRDASERLVRYNYGE
jgi:hypothetical protein